MFYVVLPELLLYIPSEDKEKLHLLPHLELSAIPPCRLASRMLEQLTRELFKHA
jgi:hypothetical protein